jgi:hypothetical protein
VTKSDRVDGADSPFLRTGTFYLAPGTLDDLPTDNPNPALPGFQGQLRVLFKYNGQVQAVVLHIASGYTNAGDNALRPLSSTLNTMRLQQRLNYLGFPDHNGKPLEVDGIVGPLTESATRLFQAAIDPDGNDIPAEDSGRLEEFTRAWLNAANAPRWDELRLAWWDEPSEKIDARFGTSWLLETIQQALSSEPPSVVAISHQNGRENGDSNGMLQSRMSVEFDISELPQASAVARFMESFASAAAGRASGGTMYVSDEAIVADYTVPLGAPPIIAQQSNGIPSGVLRIELLPPALMPYAGPALPADAITPEQIDLWQRLWEGFQDLLQRIEGQVLPTDGSAQSGAGAQGMAAASEPQGGFSFDRRLPLIQQSPGELFDVAEAFRRGVFDPVMDFFDEEQAAGRIPTGEGLETALQGATANLDGVSLFFKPGSCLDNFLAGSSGNGPLRHLRAALRRFGESTVGLQSRWHTHEWRVPHQYPDRRALLPGKSRGGSRW